MTSMSTALRRKSIQKLTITMPQTKQSRQGSRTKYQGENVSIKQLISSHNNDKNYDKKKQGDKPKINKRDKYTSRFTDDHHNTESLAELLQTKHQENVVAENPELKQSVNSNAKVDKSSSGGQNHQLETENDENFDDYVLGQPIGDENNSEQAMKSKFKKYRTDPNSIDDDNSNRYKPVSIEEKRMQIHHWNRQRIKLQKLKQEQQLVILSHEYHHNKEKLKRCSLQKQYNKKLAEKFHMNQKQFAERKNQIQRITSLPIIKAKQQIILPEIAHNLEDNNQPITKLTSLIGTKQLNQKNINTATEYKLKISLSFAKLGFGSRQPKQYNTQQFLQNEITNLQKIQKKLRNKGIVINSSKLRNSIINIRELPNYNIKRQPTTKQLPSNPIYKKYPL